MRQVAISGVSELPNRSSICSFVSSQRSSLISAISTSGSERISSICPYVLFCMLVQIMYVFDYDFADFLDQDKVDYAVLGFLVFAHRLLQFLLGAGEFHRKPAGEEV